MLIFLTLCAFLPGIFKIRHIFIMQFGGNFVKFYSRQIFRPYGICSKYSNITITTLLEQSIGQLYFVCFHHLCNMPNYILGGGAITPPAPLLSLPGIQESSVAKCLITL